jgi:hypothetical protein
MPKTRTIPNPDSALLRNAVIGGAGLGVPPDSEPPAGMGCVLLYVPLQQLVAMAPPDIQSDLGLPWAVDGGGSAWFDEL